MSTETTAPTGLEPRAVETGSGAHQATAPVTEESGAQEVSSNVTRRTFLRTSAVAAAVAGGIAAVPGLSGLLAEAESGAPAANAAVTDSGPAGAGLANLVAHVTNAETGELSVYLGEHQVVVKDPALVQRLARATGR